MEALSRIYLKYVFHTFIDENKKKNRENNHQRIIFLAVTKDSINEFIHLLIKQLSIQLE